MDRLRAALETAARPRIRRIEPDRSTPDTPPVLRIRGDNLVAEGTTPKVRIDGLPARLRLATPQELVVEPPSGALAGVLEVETGPDTTHAVVFDANDDARPVVDDEGGAS